LKTIRLLLIFGLPIAATRATGLRESMLVYHTMPKPLHLVVRTTLADSDNYAIFSV